MRKFHQLTSSLLALLFFSPITFADAPSTAGGYNTNDVTINFPAYDPGIQPVTRRVLKCGALEPKQPGKRATFQDGKFVEFVLDTKEKQKTIPAGTIATYFGMYRMTDEEGRPIYGNRGAKNVFGEGEIFYCTLDLHYIPNIENGKFLVTDGFAHVKPDVKSITWSVNNRGGKETVIKY